MIASRGEWGVGLGTKFTADRAVAAAIASRIIVGKRYSRFALVDLGAGMTAGPHALVAAVDQFRHGRADPEPDGSAARHLAVIQFIGAAEASVVGYTRLHVGALTGVTQSLLVGSEPAIGSADEVQVSTSRLLTRHTDGQIRRWAQAWLMAEVLRVAAQHRRPFVYATVPDDAEDGLSDIGVVFDRIGGTHSDEPGDAAILLRVNALASNQRLRLDYRIPKLTAATWPTRDARGGSDPRPDGATAV